MPMTGKLISRRCNLRQAHVLKMRWRHTTGTYAEIERERVRPCHITRRHHRIAFRWLTWWWNLYKYLLIFLFHNSTLFAKGKGLKNTLQWLLTWWWMYSHNIPNLIFINQICSIKGNAFGRMYGYSVADVLLIIKLGFKMTIEYLGKIIKMSNISYCHSVISSHNYIISFKNIVQ